MKSENKKRLSPRPSRSDCYLKFGGHCAYCGKEISQKEMHIDHLIPLHRGANPDWQAKHAGTNDKANLMPSCASCNNRKSVLPLEIFRAEIAAQVERLRRDSGAFRIVERYGLITVNEEPVRFFFER